MEEKSKLCLGTVQFGMKYGVKNEIKRQPRYEEVVSILDTALAAGIEIIDTANAYGTAEEVLGRYNIAGCSVKLISKMRQGISDNPDAVFNEIRNSLQRMKAHHLACYMLHDPKDMERNGIMQGLCAVKAAGLAETIGVSIYEPDEAMKAACDERIDTIQIPYNILDKRLDRNHFFEVAKKNGKTLFARSIFLQGLLLMSPQSAEQKVKGSGVYVEQFQRTCKIYSFSYIEGAMLYVLSHPAIDYVVFGVDTKNQLLDNINISIKKVEFSSCYEELRACLNVIPREIIIPSLW